MTIINRDFRVTEKKEKHPWLRWAIFSVGCVALGAVIAKTATLNVTDTNLPELEDGILMEASVEENTPAASLESAPQHRVDRKSFYLPLPELQAQQEALDQINEVSPRQWSEYKVKRGDTLSRLFKRAGLAPQQLDEVMKSGAAAGALRKIYPGDTVRVLTDSEGNIQALNYEINHDYYLAVLRDENGQLNAEKLLQETEVRVTHASGMIDSSLFMAAQDAGISETTIMELAGIFGWDIDFALDIRKGDHFTVMYEELYRNGEKISDGEILAAEFVNNKNTLRAVRYKNPQTNRTEYYTPEGKSMRKAFLRSPVDFTHISSKFTTRRYHPLLHKFRSHKGVDYAARTGTPIRSAGDGKVVFRGRKGGYGRVVIVQHGSRYSTLYAHLSKFARPRLGSKVRQGQTIGYVGKSGLATGPHLHYEFRVNGVHRNPLTVRFPSVEPVPERYLTDFKLKTSSVLAQLNLLTQTQIALQSN